MIKKTYSLREVVDETGLSKLVLHAWERRYAAIVPERTETGRRIYKHEDLIRLQLLKTCVDNGYRIGTIIHLSDSELRRALLHKQRLDEITDILDAIRTMDGDTTDRLLGARYMTLGPIEFCKQVALPLMHEVGRQWADGKISIASEHLATTAIKGLLSGAFKMMPPSRGSQGIVFSTVEGELHDNGCLIAALIARNLGVHATYLGSQLPPNDIAEAVEKTGASIVCLSGALKRQRSLGKQIKEIRAVLPDHVRLWLGGAAFAAMPPVDGTTFFEGIEDYEAALLALLDEAG